MQIKRGISVSMVQLLLANLIEQRLQAKRALWGINVTQMLVIAVAPFRLTAEPQAASFGATSTEMAAQLGLDRSAVSAQVRGLRDLGHLELISMRPTPDERERRYHLSPSGERLAVSIREHLEDIDRLMLGLLGHEELAQIHRLSRRLASGLTSCPELVRPGTARSFQNDMTRARRRATRKRRAGA
nr:MarR family winged helix-turn-helix transcriptional regulator [uncultured Roseateles sp.]